MESNNKVEGTQIMLGWEHESCNGVLYLIGSCQKRGKKSFRSSLLDINQSFTANQGMFSCQKYGPNWNLDFRNIMRLQLFRLSTTTYSLMLFKLHLQLSTTLLVALRFCMWRKIQGGRGLIPTNGKC